MKKINSKGFVLAETLVVTVFLMIIFSMIYSYFYPLIGEYEKRETYDDVDGKYAAYWVKRIIEDSSYRLTPESRSALKNSFDNYGFIRFSCSDVADVDEKRETCIELVKELEIEGCDKNSGMGCNIFITKYRIGFPDKKADGTDNPDYLSSFKYNVKQNLKHYRERCEKSKSDPECRTEYKNYCDSQGSSSTGSSRERDKDCLSKSEKNVFRSGFQDYIESLPDYKTPSLNYAKYRVIISFQHKKDNNNYYSYSTIEVVK